MSEFLLEHYRWLMALHVISVISWMAGMLYLPRLFVYHADAPKGSEMSETFKVMEKKLLRFIVTPALIASFTFGILMFTANPELLKEPWMHVKLTGVLLLGGYHGFLSRNVREFYYDRNKRSSKFFRIANEIPAVIMIIIVIMVIVKPF